MLKNHKSLIAIFGVALAAASATASTISYVVNNDTPFQTPAISTFDTLGDSMVGMDVWVSFSNGSVQHAVWSATGAGSGGASVSGYFSITESGTTYNANAWTIDNLSRTLAITGFTFFGAPGDTLFDRTFGGQVGTLGSALGKDFSISGNYIATATYSDILNLTGYPAVGDEFVRLSVAFNPSTYLSALSGASFAQDTDNAAVHGSITSVPDTASTALMLIVGCGALALAQRRMRASA